MDFNMIILCWGPLLSARLVPKSSIFTPKTSNLEHELSRNLFLLFFTGGSYHPEVNVSFNDLFRDTPLDHIWQGQQNTQIQPNTVIGQFLAAPNMVEWGIPEKIIQNGVQTH